MTQCPHCKRLIGFKQPADLCGTCQARADSEWVAAKLQRASAVFSESARYYRDHYRFVSAVESQESSAAYAKQARQRMGIES